MAEITLNNGYVIGDYHEPLFVAEMNSSHNGSIDAACEMVDSAKSIGCDAVKFQSWSAASLYSSSYYRENPIAKRIVGKFALSPDSIKQLSGYCSKKEIMFSSTPYSEEEVDFLLEECDVPYIKIASMDVTTPSFLRYIAKKNTAIVLATGMADMNEIKSAVDTLLDAGSDRLCLLHCISIYPSTPEMMQMNNMLRLREMFPNIPIGFSDHTIGCEVACAAVALGACMVEKHFTLDNKKMGMDNNMATEPDQFELMIKSCKNVFTSMGGYERIVSEQEKEQRLKMRRSVVSARALTKGTILKESDLAVKRPETGIPSDMLDQLIGKELLRDIEEDELIEYKDIR